MKAKVSSVDLAVRGRAPGRQSRGLALRRACAVIAYAVIGVASAGEDAARFATERTGVDAATEDRVLALAPEHISAREVHEVLARPASSICRAAYRSSPWRRSRNS
jgi:hypothetical protein